MNNFLETVRNKNSEKIPVWFMRQAGRYMDAYKEIRKKYSIREICMNPEITEKITYEPVKLLNVDAAIIFADIILPLEAMGYKIDFNSSGPVIYNGYRTNRDLKDIYEFDKSNLKYATYDAIKLFREKHHDTPLIGFSGGIITILSYILSGTPDNNLNYTRKIMLTDDKFRDYKKIIKNMIIDYLRMQVSAGVDAIQIFDSWLGALSPYTFNNYVKNDIIEIVNEFKGKIPVIYFATGNSGMINVFNEINPDFLSVDWKISLNDARKILNNEIGLQGNLDPYTVQYSENYAISESRYILNQNFDKDNYIFNLGHGVLPDTQAGTLKSIVNAVHNFNK